MFRLSTSSRACLIAVALLLFANSGVLQGQFRRIPRDPNGPKLESPIDESAPKTGKADLNGNLEVRFTDNSMMKLKIKEEWIEVMTQYGKLTIPVADIQRIEFGMRIPADVKKQIENAIAGLGDPEFRRRETASALLLGLREKAYPAVLEAAKSSDTEIVTRAEELAKKLGEAVPAEILKIREFDIIHTETSKIAGKIEAATLKADSAQFGEVQLRLADVFIISSKSTAPEPDTSNVAMAPGNLYAYNNQIGKTFQFKVTAQAGGTVWGTDLYTTDSFLPAAVIHAGLLQAGQTGIIKVTIMASPPVFVGSARNGINSEAYQQFPSSYRVHK